MACPHCDDGRTAREESPVSVELDDGPAFTVSVLSEVRTSVTICGEGRLNDSFSQSAADSPTRWGKVAVASALCAGICGDGCLEAFARFLRSMAQSTCFTWASMLETWGKAGCPIPDPGQFTVCYEAAKLGWKGSLAVDSGRTYGLGNELRNAKIKSMLLVRHPYSAKK